MPRSLFRISVALALVLSVLLVLSPVLGPALVPLLLYHPDRSDPGVPPALAGVAGQDVTLSAEDGVALHGWLWEAGADRPAVVIYHGNAGNIAGRLPLARGLVARDVTVLLLEYRGYGRSEGAPDEEGLYRDGEAGWDFLADRTGRPGAVVPFGRSLGGAVATHVAVSRPVPGVVVDATFTSLAAIGKAVYPILPSLAFRGIEGWFDNESRIDELGAPLLVIHGTRDGIVPPEMGRRLYEDAREPKEWYPVEGAGHNDVHLVGGDAYFDRLAAFVERVTGSD